jgi:hypothetical protein
LAASSDSGSPPDNEGAAPSPPAPEVDPDSTVGTGSVFAIGCTLLMLIILLAGIALFISRQAN